jgi:hypothetical protein
MKHGWWFKRPFILTVLASILIVGHIVFFYYIYARVGLAVLLGSILLVLIKHLGLFGPGHAFFRRRFKDKA